MFTNTQTGILDGVTVLRFAHAFESGGGTERYLDDLDGVLLRRNAMTIMRLHLTRTRPNDVVEEFIGRGRLVRVPLAVVPEIGTRLNGRSLGHFNLKKTFRDWLLYNPLVWPTVGARWTASLQLPRKTGQAVGAGVASAEIFRASRVDLAVFHFFGGADAEEIMDECKRFNVPFALVNHYSNERFFDLSIRKHTMSARAVAGVNGLKVPRYLRSHFVNLSDGIDTDFFQRTRAQTLNPLPSRPVILLPARVVREKGQMDLVRAAALLHRSGHECCLAFAGRTDSLGFIDELRKTMARYGMSERVQFLEELCATQLRDWYAASAIMALPTYHDEGLPRVILEAQSMGVPVVAYATGGVADGIVSGRTGILLRTGDVHGLANRLRELLTSPSLREKMGNSGREMVEDRFSLAALAARHEHFYAQVIGRSKPVTATPALNLAV